MLSISRKDLYGEIWSVGMTKAAKKLDIPYHNLKRACVDYGIPCGDSCEVGETFVTPK